MENKELKEIIDELESELNVWHGYYEDKTKEKPDYTDYDFYEVLKAKLEGIKIVLRINKEQEGKIRELEEKCENYKKRFQEWTSKNMFKIMKTAVKESKVPEKIVISQAEDKAKYFTEFLMSNPEYLKEIGFKREFLDKLEKDIIKKVIDKIKNSREELADLEHYQWCHWTDYLIRNYNLENKEHWRVQVLTPYNDLSEKEKKSDRHWANKVIEKLILKLNKSDNKHGKTSL